MRIAYITAGAAGRYCGNCLRDNSLALAFRKLGEDVVLIPTYTPIRAEAEDASESRLFFNGLRIYLEQKISWYRRPHQMLDRFLGLPLWVRWLSRWGANTNPRVLGELTVSMLRGELGHQRKELEELANWLRDEVKPEVVHITNVLLIGLARYLKAELGVPIVCGLQAEDSFLDYIPPEQRRQCLELIQERGAEVDALLSVSEYYARYAQREFQLPAERMGVVLPGIDLEGHRVGGGNSHDLRLGFLARLAPEKGLHLLCEAFRRLAFEPGLERLKLCIAGFAGPEQKRYIKSQLSALGRAGLGDRVEFLGTVDRKAKLEFLASLDVFCVPCIYPDPRGLYKLEAMASGVPVVCPRHGVFPELMDATKGGTLFEPGNVDNLTSELRKLLLDAESRKAYGEAAYRSVHESFGSERMARETLDFYRALLNKRVGG